MKLQPVKNIILRDTCNDEKIRVRYIVTTDFPTFCELRKSGAYRSEILGKLGANRLIMRNVCVVFTHDQATTKDDWIATTCTGLFKMIVRQ